MSVLETNILNAVGEAYLNVLFFSSSCQAAWLHFYSWEEDGLWSWMKDLGDDLI